jgi:hypothetical protein
MSNRYIGATVPDHLKWMINRTVREIKAIQDEAEATGKTTAEVAEGIEWMKRLSTANEKENSTNGN